MKYVLEMEEYLLLEEENEEVDKKKVKEFFKKNWKIIIAITGLSVTSIIAYFLFKKHPTTNIPKQYKEPEKYSPPISTSVSTSGDELSAKVQKLQKEASILFKRIDAQLNRVPPALKEEIKSKKYNIPTKKVIVNTLIDIMTPETKIELNSYVPDIIAEIINKSKNRKEIINNIVTAFQQGKLVASDVPPTLMNDFKKEYNSRTPVLTDEIWKERLKELEHQGINYDELSDDRFKVYKAGLKSTDEKYYMTSLQKIKNIKKKQGNYWNKKDFGKASRLNAIKEIGLSPDDFDKKTMSWLQQSNRTDFFDYINKFKNNYAVDKEYDWKKKIILINKAGFNIADFDVVETTTMKSLTIDSFKEYLKQLKVVLHKSLEHELDVNIEI